MRITVFGANGPTGRLLTDQALAAGHQVTAVTRRPNSFPLHHDRLEVIGADVLHPAAVDAAVAERDAVLSTIGVVCASDLDWTIVRPSGLYDHRWGHHDRRQPHLAPVDPARCTRQEVNQCVRIRPQDPT